MLSFPKTLTFEFTNPNIPLLHALYTGKPKAARALIDEIKVIDLFCEFEFFNKGKNIINIFKIQIINSIIIR